MVNTTDTRQWERDHELKVREIELKERQFSEEATQRKRSLWSSPLVLAILAAAVAAGGNALVAAINGSSNREVESKRSGDSRELEIFKAEAGRILQVIVPTDPEQSKTNLRFLLEAGLITNLDTRERLNTYLKSQPTGVGPALGQGASVPDGGLDLLMLFEGFSETPVEDAVGRATIGYGHNITRDEMQSGEINAGSLRIDIEKGISQVDAVRLLAFDMEEIGRRLDKLIKVKLTRNQRDALISFVYNTGIGAFGKSSILEKLNDGKYEEVPAGMMKFVKMGGRVLQGLVRRREMEVALWNKPD